MSKLLNIQKEVFNSLISILPKTLIREIIYEYIEYNICSKFLGHVYTKLHAFESLVTITNDKLIICSQDQNYDIIDLFTHKKVHWDIPFNATVTSYKDYIFAFSNIYSVRIDNTGFVTELKSNVVTKDSKILVNSNFIIIIKFISKLSYNVKLFNHEMHLIKLSNIVYDVISDFSCDDFYIYLFDLRGVIRKYEIKDLTKFTESYINQKIYGHTTSDNEIFISSLIDNKCVISIFNKTDLTKVREFNTNARWLTLFAPIVYYKNSLFLVNEDKIEMWKQCIE